MPLHSSVESSVTLHISVWSNVRCYVFWFVAPSWRDRYDHDQRQFVCQWIDLAPCHQSRRRAVSRQSSLLSSRGTTVATPDPQRAIQMNEVCIVSFCMNPKNDKQKINGGLRIFTPICYFSFFVSLSNSSFLDHSWCLFLDELLWSEQWKQLPSSDKSDWSITLCLSTSTRSAFQRQCKVSDVSKF